MRKIHDIILEIRNESSSNAKKNILTKYKNDEDLKTFLIYVYDEVKRTYGKSALPMIPKVDNHIDGIVSVQDDMSLMYDLLDDMASGDITGKNADNCIQDLLVTKEDYYVELFALILKRDLKSKIGARSINEVFGHGFITIPPYMRCEKEDKLEARIKYPAYAQTKEDGLFLNTEVWRNDGESVNEVRVTTRQGFEMNPCPEIFKHISKAFAAGKRGVVFHGEVLILDENGEYMDRATGNGLVNSYVQQHSTRKNKLKEIANASNKQKPKFIKQLEQLEIKWKYTAENMVYVVWDFVDRLDWTYLYSGTPYNIRFKYLQQVIKSWNEQQSITQSVFMNRFKLVKTIIVKNKEELMDFYNDNLELGLEGVVVKNADLLWEQDVTTQGMIKLKEFKDCDLLIVGWNYGKQNTQFEKGVGSLMCESSDGLLVVDVSGLTMGMRGFRRVDPNDSSKGIELIEDFDPDIYIGKIAAAKFNAVTKPKKGLDKYSLNLPNIVEIREASDKTKADTLQYILNQ